MKRALCATGGAASVVMLVLVSVAVGSTGLNRVVKGKSLVAIREHGDPHMSAGNAVKGRFVLLLDGVISDSGTTSIHPNNGQEKLVDGQRQNPIYAYDTLTSKKGTLSFNIRGVSVPITNIDPTKAPSYNESGTWKISKGTGTYKGWTGGGRWASVGNAGGNTNEWDGYVTH